MEEACSLCRPGLEALVESKHWRLVVNRNQNLLGKCMLVLRRHLEIVPQLTVEEWVDLYPQVQRVHAALKSAFAPDHFNYAFLQNQDRHVHLHIIPRYASPRTSEGIVFEDPDYPAHYSVPGPTRILEKADMDKLSEQLGLYLTV